MRHKFLMLILVFLLTACTGSEPGTSEVPAELADQVYEEFSDDRVLLRQTVRNDRSGINASSGEAIAAALRVFDRIDFVGMSKEDVLVLLGPPETISDYGQPMETETDAPLVYRFDNGRNGQQWTLRFHNGVVTEVERVGLI